MSLKQQTGTEHLNIFRTALKLIISAQSSLEALLFRSNEAVIGEIRHGSLLGYTLCREVERGLTILR